MSRICGLVLLQRRCAHRLSTCAYSAISGPTCVKKFLRLGQTSLVSSGTDPPWYQATKGWILPLFEYFGDAGIFPEIHVADYPLDTGGRKTFRMHWPSSGIMKGKLNMMLLLNRDHPKTRALTLNTPTSFQRRSGMLMTRTCKGPMKRPLKRSQKRHEWPCRRKVALAMPDHAAHKLDPAQ